MSNYTKSTNFTAKDSLPSGDPGKIIKGSEFDTEFDALETSVNSKADKASPTFTGTSTFAGISVSGTFTFGGTALTVTAVELNYVDGVTSSIQTQLDGKAASAHTHAASDITSGTFADARISESSVTQHQASINAGKVDGKDVVVTDEATYSGLTPDANTLYFVTA